MTIDHDTSGQEQAQQDIERAQSYRPFAGYVGIKIDGEWCISDKVGNLTRAIAKADSVGTVILFGREHVRAYATKAIQSAIKKRFNNPLANTPDRVLRYLAPMIRTGEEAREELHYRLTAEQ